MVLSNTIAKCVQKWNHVLQRLQKWLIELEEKNLQEQPKSISLGQTWWIRHRFVERKCHQLLSCLLREASTCHSTAPKAAHLVWQIWTYCSHAQVCSLRLLKVWERAIQRLHRGDPRGFALSVQLLQHKTQIIPPLHPVWCREKVEFLLEQHYPGAAVLFLSNKLYHSNTNFINVLQWAGQGNVTLQTTLAWEAVYPCFWLQPKESAIRQWLWQSLVHMEQLIPGGVNVAITEWWFHGNWPSLRDCHVPRLYASAQARYDVLWYRALHHDDYAASILANLHCGHMMMIQSPGSLWNYCRDWTLHENFCQVLHLEHLLREQSQTKSLERVTTAIARALVRPGVRGPFSHLHIEQRISMLWSRVKNRIAADFLVSLYQGCCRTVTLSVEELAHVRKWSQVYHQQQLIELIRISISSLSPNVLHSLFCSHRKNFWTRNDWLPFLLTCHQSYALHWVWNQKYPRLRSRLNCKIIPETLQLVSDIAHVLSIGESLSTQ